jgi:hypothetical protein
VLTGFLERAEGFLDNADGVRLGGAMLHNAGEQFAVSGSSGDHLRE